MMCIIVFPLLKFLAQNMQIQKQQTSKFPLNVSCQKHFCFCVFSTIFIISRKTPLLFEEYFNAIRRRVAFVEGVYDIATTIALSHQLIRGRQEEIKSDTTFFDTAMLKYVLTTKFHHC